MKFGESDADRAALLAKRAIRYLVHDSKAPAVALVHRVGPDRNAAPFPGRETYERMAADAGLFVVPVAQALPAGYDHVLFLSKVADLSDDALLACRPPAARNRHAAGDGPGRA